MPSRADQAGDVPLSRRQLCLCTAAAGLAPWAQVRPAQAAQGFVPSRLIPERQLPVPSTVSADLRQVIGAPYPTGWDVVPATPEAWKELVAQLAADVAPHLSLIRQRLNIQVERQTMAGVPVFVVTPDALNPETSNHLLLHLHGGGYVLYPGEAGAGEAMLMAGYGRFRVVSVDYRMAPEFPFPAALDDAMAVWRELAGRNDPSRMAVFGSSAGGGLTLALMLRAKSEGLPLPAAIAPGTPWADLTNSGDTIQAHAYIDNALVSMTGWAGAAASLYAAGRDLRDPLVSPLFGDFRGLPPAIVTSGTRDLLLSDAVRVHRKLRQASCEAELHVFEGQSHAQFLTPLVPETEEAFGEITRFFKQHLKA